VGILRGFCELYINVYFSIAELDAIKRIV